MIDVKLIKFESKNELIENHRDKRDLVGDAKTVKNFNPDDFFDDLYDFATDKIISLSKG